MPTVISIDKPDISGDAGPFTLFLRTKAGALVNTGGDALTEILQLTVPTGRWVATVAEALTDDVAARIYEGTTETPAALIWRGWLALGRTELQSEPPLGSGDASQTTLLNVQTAVNALSVAIAGATPAPVVSPNVVQQLTELRGLVQTAEGAALYTTVRPGGKIVLKAGDDYVASELYTIDVPIEDASEAAYVLLTRAQTTSIKFGASRRISKQADQITGTISKAAVYKNAGKTYVPVEISGAALTNLIVGDNFLYDIQTTSTAGKKRTVCSGEMVVERDNAA